jgi:hypothetical protein
VPRQLLELTVPVTDRWLAMPHVPGFSRLIADVSSTHRRPPLIRTPAVPPEPAGTAGLPGRPRRRRDVAHRNGADRRSAADGRSAVSVRGRRSALHVWRRRSVVSVGWRGRSALPARGRRSALRLRRRRPVVYPRWRRRSVVSVRGRCAAWYGRRATETSRSAGARSAQTPPGSGAGRRLAAADCLPAGFRRFRGRRRRAAETHPTRCPCRRALRDRPSGAWHGGRRVAGPRASQGRTFLNPVRQPPGVIRRDDRRDDGTEAGADATGSDPAAAPRL